MKIVACERWDNLDHWNLPADEKDKIKAIGWVVMCDTESMTHLCDLQGSYWYEYLYPIVVLKDDVEDPDQTLVEKLVEYQRSATEDLGDYSKKELWLHGNCRWADHSRDDPDETPEEIWESWRESWNGNYPL
jgi:hypothetical protein